MTSDTAPFAEAIKQTQSDVEQRLVDIIDRQQDAPETIREAMRYVVLGGGKRLRPVLCLWTHDGLGGRQHDAVLDVACAIECMHAYSLVHDDLPCMDDDDLRRGKPSCHRQFGEAVAVLTGDALASLCFETVSTLGERWAVSDTDVVSAFRVLARAAGSNGLITGQALDLVSDELEPTLQNLDRIHRYKTAALIAAAMEAGAVMAGADPAIRRRVTDVGIMAGRAFQIIDDILDVQMDGKTIGKTPGKDAKAGKLTYPSLVGIDASKTRAAALIEQAKSGLAEITRVPRLATLLDFIVSRTN